MQEKEIEAQNGAGISSNVVVDVVTLPPSNHVRPTKESIAEIISKASKYNGRNVLHRRQDAEEAARQAAGGEQDNEPAVPEDFGEGESDAEPGDNDDMISICESEEDDHLNQ